MQSALLVAGLSNPTVTRLPIHRHLCQGKKPESPRDGGEEQGVAAASSTKILKYKLPTYKSIHFFTRSFALLSFFFVIHQGRKYLLYIPPGFPFCVDLFLAGRTSPFHYYLTFSYLDSVLCPRSLVLLWHRSVHSITASQISLLPLAGSNNAAKGPRDDLPFHQRSYQRLP